ncbi:MAG: hypothetical protein AAF035_02360 [Pseudomonadota bacterium]
MASSVRYSAGEKRQVRAALQEIVRSEHFSTSSQLTDFLTFIVEKTLSGEAEDIKAYTIAVDALGRSEDFDPQTNAAVRVAAGRLRQALSLFNAGLDRVEDSVQIALEPGSYIPVFSFKAANPGPSVATDQEQTTDSENTDTSGLRTRTESSQTHLETAIIEQDFKQNLTVARVAAGASVGLVLLALLFVLQNQRASLPAFLGGTEKVKETAESPNTADIRPTVRADIILPEAEYPDWYVPSETAEAVRVTVSRFDDLQFLGSKLVKSQPVTSSSPVDYQIVITAYPRGSLVRFYGNLIRTSDNKIIWSTQRLFGAPNSAEDRSVPQIVGSIFASIGSPYGVIHADVAQRDSESCLTKVYAYFYTQSDKKHQEARSCAQDLIASGSQLPVIHATLTFLLLDEYREGRNPQSQDPLADAMATAQKAVELAPQSARAHQARFAVFKVRRLRDQARKAGLRAVELNPFDTDILADYGAWLISVGELEAGRALLNRADALLGVRPAWMEFYFFLGAQLAGQVDEAARIARTMDIERSPLLALAAAMGASLRGDLPRKDLALASLNRQAPVFLINPEDQFRRRGYSEDVIKTLVDTMRVSNLLKRPPG